METPDDWNVLRDRFASRLWSALACVAAVARAARSAARPVFDPRNAIQLKRPIAADHVPFGYAAPRQRGCQHDGNCRERNSMVEKHIPIPDAPQIIWRTEIELSHIWRMEPASFHRSGHPPIIPRLPTLNNRRLEAWWALKRLSMDRRMQGRIFCAIGKISQSSQRHAVIPV